MAASLTKEQGLALVKRLAEDDGFRALFETDIMAALSQLGIDADLGGKLSTLDPKCACVLGSKAHFASILRDLDESKAQLTMSMTVPQLAIG